MQALLPLRSGTRALSALAAFAFGCLVMLAGAVAPRAHETPPPDGTALVLAAASVSHHAPADAATGAESCCCDCVHVVIRNVAPDGVAVPFESARYAARDDLAPPTATVTPPARPPRA